MTHLWDLLRAQLGNQFVGGGLVLMLTGSVIALARQMPGRMVGWVKRRFTRGIEIDNYDPLFDYVTYWMNSQEKFRRSRWLKATTQLRIGQSNDSVPCESSSRKERLRVFFTPAVGRNVLRYQGVWVSIRKGDKAAAQAPATSDGQSLGQGLMRKDETYTLESYGRNDGSVLKSLVEEIIEFGTQETDGVRVYFSVWGHWSSNGYMRMRPLRTVVLPEGVAEEALADMQEFRAAHDWYRDLGIPWHKGYLLHGLPGTGKTSLAAALAGELGMDLYLLNLSGTGMNDESLQRLMSDVRTGCMVILEDVDCTIPDREAAVSNSRITLSGLLNCLDGIMSREGCIIVMTTNHRESLDAALIRPGRVDYEVEFGYATAGQIMRLRDRLAPGRDVSGWGRMTMAEVQQELLRKEKKVEVMVA